ncbi:MAG: O-antigen ligase family protein [Methylobacter sp.]|nr:O-antigen ligase family protein [Methylobacter sp.]
MAIITAIASPISTALTSVASIAMLLTWLISGELFRSLKISAEQPTGKMLLLFFAWLLIGTVYADTNWIEKIETLSSWKKLAFTFVLLGLFYQTHWKRLFVGSYLAVMAIAGLVAIPLWLADLTVRQGREPGIFMTNYASQSMAFIAAIICCIFLLKQQLSVKKKYLLYGVIALFILNIFFVSPARSGYMAFPFAVVFAASCVYGNKKLLPIIAVTGSVMLVAILCSSTLQQRTQMGLTEKAAYQTSGELTSIGVRVIFAKNTLSLIKEHPVLGYGTSSFKSTYGPYAAAQYSDWRGSSTSDPHNQYLFVWLENGLIGLLLFLAYIYTAIRQGLNNRPYGAIAASFLVAVCASSLFNSHFKTFPEGNLLAFFAGILLAQYSAESKENSDS